MLPRLRHWGQRGSLRRGTGAEEGAEVAGGVDGSAGGVGYPCGQRMGCKALHPSAPAQIWICARLRESTFEMIHLLKTKN